ncbi:MULTISPECIES: YhgE/Pip domain-containing protein [unclassified Streptomyces]|uniref:YhgE/Pip domain-containing protein n=1 Tax=Streptomyces TaxID=1883 RepID=UPI000897A139|nr:YhgE/Pip N-terminal domain-containing protein [Streptomyces sp. PAN_FS17]SEE05641.1 YhgE/Pip N-terminal domain-containing protein [Streptomyces sp. KS_5]
MSSKGSGKQPSLARAVVVARHGKLWLVPTILSALVALCLTLLYMGGILNPNGNLRHLPIALVNSDQGPPLPGQQQTLGEQVSRSVAAATPADAVQWRQLSRAQMQDQLASGKIYGALVIPSDFTTSVAALTTTQATERPALTVLTNPGLGSLGSSLASQITQRAAHEASLTIGRQLAAHASEQGANNTTRSLLGDPVAVTTKVGHPIGGHSGLGLSGFYFTLLLVLIGFVGGNIINNGVDAALGYTDNEIGPWHTRRPTVPISRTQTLLLKMLMTAGISVITTSLIMIAAIGILGMDASHLPLLWIFAYCASLAVGLGVQAINAAFGGIGQVVSMFVFIALALPSSGATIPLHAVPGFYRFLALFEPMRQLSDGVRAILYFDARADAGLARGWVMIAIGGALALLFGFGMALYYDRRGLHRLTARPAPPASPRQPESS